MPENTDISSKLHNEKQHAEYLLKNEAESVWGWSSPAGRRRAERRAGFFIREMKRGTRALELGCGTGLFTRMVARCGADIVATDISQDLLVEAKRLCEFENIAFEVADAHALRYEDDSFDVVYGSSVLHHLEVTAALSEILRVLKPRGLAVFAEPNMLNPQIWAERNIARVRKYVGASQDETAFVGFVLARTMRDTGFEDVVVRPHEFLHPAVPKPLIPVAETITAILESLPVIRQIAGSLFIKGRKP